MQRFGAQRWLQGRAGGPVMDYFEEWGVQVVKVEKSEVEEEHYRPVYYVCRVSLSHHECPCLCVGMLSCGYICGLARV